MIMNRPLNMVLESLDKSDRVKVVLPNGIYYEGKKRKVQRDIKRYNSDLAVAKTETRYTSVPFNINLCKEIVIYVN